jgi:hypothetical protein
MMSTKKPQSKDDEKENKLEKKETKSEIDKKIEIERAPTKIATTTTMPEIFYMTIEYADRSAPMDVKTFHECVTVLYVISRIL